MRRPRRYMEYRVSSIAQVWDAPYTRAGARGPRPPPIFVCGREGITTSLSAAVMDSLIKLCTLVRDVGRPTHPRTIIHYCCLKIVFETTVRLSCARGRHCSPPPSWGRISQFISLYLIISGPPAFHLSASPASLALSPSLQGYIGRLEFRVSHGLLKSSGIPVDCGVLLTSVGPQMSFRMQGQLKEYLLLFQKQL